MSYIPRKVWGLIHPTCRSWRYRTIWFAAVIRLSSLIGLFQWWNYRRVLSQRAWRTNSFRHIVTLLFSWTSARVAGALEDCFMKNLICLLCSASHCIFTRVSVGFVFLAGVLLFPHARAFLRVFSPCVVSCSGTLVPAPSSKQWYLMLDVGIRAVNL